MNVFRTIGLLDATRFSRRNPIRLLSAFCPILMLLAAAVIPPVAPSQISSNTETSPRFAVAAIHVHEPLPGENNIIKGSPVDGRFHTENIRVITLIHWAYEMPDMRILGAPKWTNSIHFNIDATSSPEVDQQLRNLPRDAGRKLKEKMVQALLAERFGFVAHIETREMPIYQLVVAKDGPKLGAIQQDGCGVSQDISNGRIQVRGPNSVALLAEELSKVAGRDAIDKTGITGCYNLKLEWTPDDAQANQTLNGTLEESAPPLFTAIKEQLGLKLEPAKGPVQVLVIDHLEQPSPN